MNGLGFLPEHGRGFEAVLEDTERVILPHLLRTWSVDYMPHLHSPVLTETICSELIISCFNDSMDSWDQGPAATELEESMVHGLTGLFGLPEGSDGCFTSGGSQSNITALMAARDRYCRERLGWDVRADGLPPEFGKLRVYTSEISHFSMDKASHILGMGYAAVRKIPVDEKCRVDIDAFERMVEEDAASGLLPFCAVATFGTTDFGSIDDATAMRGICDRHGMHLHGDAAYGSGLIMSDRYRDRVSALSVCDSITVDFHKMFLLPISCSAILVRDADLLRCFEFHADYLNRVEDEEDGYINLVGKSMQTTRRFDALKVYMAFQTRGMDGFGRIIDTAVENAAYLYGRVSSDGDFFAPVEPEMSERRRRAEQEGQAPAPLGGDGHRPDGQGRQGDAEVHPPEPQPHARGHRRSGRQDQDARTRMREPVTPGDRLEPPTALLPPRRTVLSDEVASSYMAVRCRIHGMQPRPSPRLVDVHASRYDQNFVLQGAVPDPAHGFPDTVCVTGTASCRDRLQDNVRRPQRPCITSPDDIWHMRYESIM